MIRDMGFRGERGRQWLLRGWLILTGCTIGLLLGVSAWLRLQGQPVAAQACFGWAIVVMLISVYVSDVIRGVRRIAENEPVRCCECCEQRRADTEIHLPPPPQPGDRPNLRKI